MHSKQMQAMHDELKKIAEEAQLRGRAGFRQGAMAELGPAAGAVMGAGLAQAYGVNPVAGAAGGYGLGALPEIIHGLRHRVK